MEVTSGGYLARCEAAREISTTFTGTEVNNIVLVYTTQAESLAAQRVTLFVKIYQQKPFYIYQQLLVTGISTILF